MKVYHGPMSENMPNQAMVSSEQVSGTIVPIHDSPNFRVPFMPLLLRTMWITMAIMHSLCIGFFGVESWVYWKISLSYLAPVFQFFSVIMPASVLHRVSVYFAVVAIAHSLLVLDMLLKIARCRLFTFPSNPYRHSGAMNRDSFCSRRWLIAQIVHIYNLVFGERGLLGARGRHFAVVYATRKIFESLLQSVQAYCMSRLVSHAAVNYFFVLTIVATCWLTPVVYHVFRYNPVLVRLLCLILDFIMAFVTAVGIPLILSAPYLKQYDYEIADFPAQLWTDDVWFANMINDLHVVFISSWSSFVTQITFSVSILLCLQDIKSLLRPHSPPSTKSGVILLPGNSDVQLKIKRATRSRPSFAVPLSPLDAGMLRILHALMVFWGFAILVLHLRVAFRSRPQYCMYDVRSWFSSKAECTILYVDCNTIAGSTGNLTEIDAALDQLDEHFLIHFRVQNCPFVEIPPRIQKFSQIEDVTILNSTLARWDSDAELTAMNHPKMTYFYGNELNLTQIPLGLLSPDFPPRLRAISFHTTNLTTVPDNTADIWPDHMYISVNHSQLQLVPLGLLKQSSRELSLTYNNITTLPQEFFSNPSAINIWLTGNPIAALPDALIPSVSIELIDLTNTNLQSLPSWANAAFFQYTVMCAGGTPLCDQVLAAESANSTSEDLVVALEAYHTGHLQCNSFG